MSKKQLSREGVKEYFDLTEEEYKELEGEGLIPDHSEKSEEKFGELIKNGPPFTDEEVWFLGAMNVVKLQEEYPEIAEEYMDM